MLEPFMYIQFVYVLLLFTTHNRILIYSFTVKFDHLISLLKIVKLLSEVWS